MQTVVAGSVVRLFVGRDDAPVAIPDDALLEHVNDPFAAIALQASPRPQTLQELISVLDAATGPQSVPGQRVYRVADGGQIGWSDGTAGLDRHLRIVVTRHRGEEAELFVSTSPPFDSPNVFLQVFAWDPKLGAYNFYERRRGVWSWAGTSWGAHEPDTRGLGPFDSHVNGGPVMKELKQPWLNWHSQSAQIRDDMLAPDDPLRTDPFYQADGARGLRGAEDLELIVRAGVARWTDARMTAGTTGGRLADAPAFLRHLLTTTTVNLVAANERSAGLADGDVVRLPATFFLNTDLIADDLALPLALGRLKVDAALYKACLSRYAVRLRDEGQVLELDGFFAFAVPEPSLDDSAVVRALRGCGALSRKLALCLLAVDFPNPVFSPAREALLAHVPDTVVLDSGGDLERSFVKAVRASPGAGARGSAESAFLDIWDLPEADWESTLVRRIEGYWSALRTSLQTDAGYDAIFRLAESRRRQFRKRPLAEFGLTLPVATLLDVPVPLQMTEQGSVVPIA